MIIDILITALTVVFALLVVFTKKTVVSAFSLLMTLLCVAVIYFQLGAMFLAAVQVLVNAGAVAILFVFVMMLINLEQYKAPKNKSKAKLIFTIFTMLVSMSVLALIINNNIEILAVDNLKDNTMLGLFESLFNVYYLPFEIVTVLLLAAIIASIVLTGHFKKPRKEA